MTMTMENYPKQWKIIIAVLALVLIYVLFFHHKPDTGASEKEIKVSVQKPLVKNLAEYITQTGNTAAYQSVDLVARVEGYLQSQDFKDGADVKKGKSLFVIEPEPYLEKLKEAKATVAAKEASLAYAQAEYARQQRMYKQNATSLNSVEKWRAQKDEAMAGLAESKAQAVNAEINYSYTHIKSPFDGRIGRHLVDLGNLVGNGQATKLATVEQINPIYVYFNLNELDLIKLRNAALKEGMSKADIATIPVYIRMQDETEFKHKGHLDFVDTGLNASTGTMEFRAILDNKGLPMVPGLFVQVKVPVSKARERLTVPSDAIQYDQVGAYLLVVNKDNVVEERRVTPGGLSQNMTVINEGLQADDLVIVEGLQYAVVGEKVQPELKS